MRKTSTFLWERGTFFCAVLLLLTGWFFLPVAQAKAATTVIDDFSGSSVILNADAGAPGAESSQIGAMIGNIRWLDLNWDGGPNGVWVNVASSQVSFSADTQTRGTLFVTWNGNANLQSSSLAKNLYKVGDRFVLKVHHCDMGADLSLRVYSSANAFSAATISIPPNLVVTDAQPFIKLLSEFTQGQGAVSPVDWTNVNRIEMFIHGSVNLDITIGDLSMECQDAAPIIHQFYATPNPLEDVPPLTVELCYQVENPAGGATTMTITDITHGVSVPGPFVADNALHCVSGVNIPSAPVTFLLDAEKGCIGSNATVTIMIESCTKPAPTLHQFYAYPNPLNIPPPQTIDLCYQVENPAGGSTVLSIMDTTHAVPVPGLFTADNALHCVSGVNVPSVPTAFVLSATNGCTGKDSDPLIIVYQKIGAGGKVPGLTGVGALILALVLAVFAVSRLRKKRSSG